MQRALLILPVLLLASAAAGQRIYVDAQARSNGDGKSWATAFDRLEAGLKAASAGSSVWVAAGTYAGGFQVPAGVNVLGGFRSGQARVTQRNPSAHASILDGGTTQRVVQLGDKSVLDGFTVMRGLASSAPGGGAAVVSGVRATIRGCFFTQNKNTGGRGSAVHVLERGDLRLENSVFYKNMGFGHVIDFTTASGVVNNIVVYDNLDNGLHFHQGSSVAIYNSVFAKNTGRGLCHISANDTPIVENNLLWNNTISFYHYRGRELRTLAEVNDLPYAKNNITGDPMFVDPAKHDFRLKQGSPAVDAGLNTIPRAVIAAMDLYGNSRLLDGNLDGRMLADIGAGEHSRVSLSVTGNLTPGGKLSLQLASTTSLAGIAILGIQPTSLLIDPFGYLFVDVAAGALLFPVPTNTAVVLPIPKEIPKGTALALQGAGFTTAGGNTSNLADVQIQ